MQLLLVGFIVYFLIIGLIALVSSVHHKKSAQGEYGQVILGNRSVNYFLTAFSAHASDMSQWLFMGFVALFYTNGFMSGPWIALGLVIGMWFTWQFIAPELRKKTEYFKAYTLSTFFDKRFQDHAGILRLLSAFISLFFFAIYIAAGLKGFGFLAESLFNLPYIVGTLVAIIFVIFYIIFGGYKALAWIDCFQALFLLLVIFIVPYVAFGAVGGWQAILNAAHEKNISLTLLPKSLWEVLNGILLAFSWGVGYIGMPHLLTKFMGITDVKEMHKAKYIGLSWQVSVLTAAGMAGLIGIAYFPLLLAKPELVFVEMVKNLFSQLSAGFILSAIAGATLSVITAQMLVLISVITEDFYKGIFRPAATSRELLLVYRISILIIALLSLCISLNRTITIHHLVDYAWIGFGSSFAPLVLLSLHSKYINKYGAYACLIVGSVIAALWPTYVQPLVFGAYGLDISAVIPGFGLSVLAAYIVSSITR